MPTNHDPHANLDEVELCGPVVSHPPGQKVTPSWTAHTNPLAERGEPLTAQVRARINLGTGGRPLLLAQANALTSVVTGAGDTLNLRHAALRWAWHTHPGGGVLHLAHGALGYRCRRAGRWYGEDGNRGRCRDGDRESTGKD